MCPTQAHGHATQARTSPTQPATKAPSARMAMARAAQPVCPTMSNVTMSNVSVAGSAIIKPPTPTALVRSHFVSWSLVATHAWYRCNRACDAARRRPQQVCGGSTSPSSLSELEELASAATSPASIAATAAAACCAARIAVMRRLPTTTRSPLASRFRSSLAPAIAALRSARFNVVVNRLPPRARSRLRDAAGGCGSVRGEALASVAPSSAPVAPSSAPVAPSSAPVAPNTSARAARSTGSCDPPSPSSACAAAPSSCSDWSPPLSAAVGASLSAAVGESRLPLPDPLLPASPALPTCSPAGGTGLLSTSAGSPVWPCCAASWSASEVMASRNAQSRPADWFSDWLASSAMVEPRAPCAAR